MSGGEPAWNLYGAFLSVLHEGSLSGAARALGLTQPTVRRQIEELEEELGVVLFTRASNGLVPTEAARHALPYAESIAATARALRRAVTEEPHAVRGTVRITCSEIMGLEVLPAMLTALKQQWPELQLELVATNRNEDLLRRDADVAVRMVEPVQAGLVRKLATRIEIGLFAHADYLARHAAPRSLHELSKGHVLVGADRGRALIEGLASLGVQLSPRHFALRSDSDAVQLAAVRSGFGIGVCQVPLSRAPVPLVRVVPKLAVPLDAWVVMHEDLRGSPRVRAVFEGLCAQLAGYGDQAQRAPRVSAKQRPRQTAKPAIRQAKP